MKKTKYIVIALLTMIIIIFPLTINASQIIDPSDYDPGKLTQEDVGTLATTTGTILSYVRNIGIIVSVIALTLIGIKYMLGSLEDKAEYKENMRLYVIGCFVLMMSASIPSIIYEIMK